MEGTKQKDFSLLFSCLEVVKDHAAPLVATLPAIARHVDQRQLIANLEKVHHPCVSLKNINRGGMSNFTLA